MVNVAPPLVLSLINEIDCFFFFQKIKTDSLELT
jgi:hypothetical protein